MAFPQPLIDVFPDLAGLPPPRAGSRPRTHVALPHIQLDQWSSGDIAEELIQRSLRLPDVRGKQSRMASPNSKALCLPDIAAGGPPDAFIDDHEFCHLHAAPACSAHLTLPNPLRERVVELGWAEPHPAVRSGIVPKTLVMVYAPRNREELKIVLSLVWNSCQFAKGI